MCTLCLRVPITTVIDFNFSIGVRFVRHFCIWGFLPAPFAAAHQQDVMYWLTGMTGSDWLWLAWLVPGVASHASQTLCIASVLPFTSVIPARCGICQSLLVKPVEKICSQSKCMLIAESAIAILCWPEW